MVPSFPRRPLIHLAVAIPVAVASILLLFVFTTARAAPNALTFTVNSTLDAVDSEPGDGLCATSGSICTLRAAIMEANHTPGGGVTIMVPAGLLIYNVAIPASGTDDETTGDLNITANMSIVGKPSRFSSSVIIDAAIAHDRVFSIDSGTVTISNISSITNGQAADGGGIYNAGSLTLNSTTVFSNTATGSAFGDGGGGVYNAGSLTLTNSTVISNTSTSGDGGGIVNHMTLTLTDSSVNSNNALLGGGGIENDGAMTLIASTISGNTSIQDTGGGIDNSPLATFTVTNSTISGNTAAEYGGGIYNGNGSGSLTNVTLSGNSALYVGGILENATLASRTVTLKNTLISKGVSGGNCRTTLNPLISAGYNLSDDTDCSTFFNKAGDLNNTNPKLGALGNNGGPTQTNALLPGSPALDKIPSGTNGCGTTITTDQRGSPRPVNGKCDIGAYESTAAPATPTPTHTPIHTPTRTPTPKPTLMPTATPCAGKPLAPMLLSPSNGQPEGKARVKLVWSAVACATKYKIVVDENTPGGVRVDGKKVTVNHYKTVPLAAGKTYYWRVKACDASGCTKSVWDEFTRVRVLPARLRALQKRSQLGKPISGRSAPMPALFAPRSFNRLAVVLPVFVGCLLVALASTAARAAPNALTFTVGSTLDAVDANPGDGICATSGNLCTLRAAIMEANHTPGGGAIINVPAGPYTYLVAIPASGPDDETSGDLNITANMSIIGKASRFFTSVIIDASIAHDRVFYINAGTVTISNISSITNGQAADGGGIYNVGSLTLNSTTVFSNTANDSAFVDGGGGIYNAGSLTLTNSTVISNTATHSNAGGGIYNFGSLSVANSTFSGNRAYGGGGIFNSTSATATVSNSNIIGNTGEDGGGIESLGSITLTNTTVSDNQADEQGGGIDIENKGTATLTDMTLSGNFADRFGGGLNNAGTVTLVNSTLSGNTVYSSGSFSGGGGIANWYLGTLTNVTISGNSATNGGGIYQRGDGGSHTLTFKNTILSTGATGSNCYLYSFPPQSDGYNLSSDLSCVAYLNRSGDLNNTNPKLGALANNGGPTQTNALLSGSPALDQIPPGTNGCGTTITTDQRGDPRPYNGKCDIGAYESNAPLPTATPTRTRTLTPTATHTPTRTPTRTSTPKPPPSATPCAAKPTAPTLLQPANGQQEGKVRVLLTWSAVACATKYKVIVDAGSTGGVRVDHDKAMTDQYKTIALPAGKHYYWRVKACNAAGCTKSVWDEFTRT